MTAKMPSTELFSLRPVALKQLPRETTDPGYGDYRARHLAASRAILDSIEGQWTHVKTYRKPLKKRDGKEVTIETYTSPDALRSAGHRWSARKSRHVLGPKGIGLDWQDFVAGLTVDREDKEARYIPTLVHHEKLMEYSPKKDEFETWRVFYKMPFMVTDRDMVQVIVTVHGGGGDGGQNDDSFTVIQHPGDGDLPRSDFKGKTVRGGYESIEHLRWIRPQGDSEADDDHGQVEWTMCTTSEVGGMLPKYFVDKALPGNIWQDVPSFIDFMLASRVSP